MKKILVISLLIVVMMAVAISAEGIKPAGVRINGELIDPGKEVALVIAIAGPPDWFRAIRGKESSPDSDYVMFEYRTYGINIHINNKTNTVQGIYIDNRNVTLESIPFNVGESAKKVTSSWGEPDNETSGVMVYWKRGVYVSVDETGTVNHLFLSAPGAITDKDSEQYEKEKGKSPDQR